ncbi:uncharacterized protein [Temnothorax nylanderi]|uniref:uncharacterized protein isoform X1 n=1 Tax=Temnothorax nylanderi TaxID=102681 RepID=UPI003A8476C2
MNNNITLIKGRHQVVMAGDVPLFNSDGNLLVQDVQDNNIFVVPVCEETIKFFNLRLTEESSIHNSDSGNICMTEQPESIVSFTAPSATSSAASAASSTVSSATSAAACWKDDNEVKCLIHLWQDHENHFKTMKSRDVWSLISKDLIKTNPEWKQKTHIQCENKWKDIKRKYMETKDHNNKSGNDPKTCKFYEDLDEILGEKPCVKPVSLASNLNKRHRTMINSKEQNDFDEIFGDSESSTSQSEEGLPKTKKKMTRVERELKDWSAALLADAQVREEARERRHKEVIAESKVAIDIYKEMMGKLIDKL